MPSRLSRPNQIRVYKGMAVMLAAATVLVILYGVRDLSETIRSNLVQTNCNQGLLLLATVGVRDEEKLENCSPEVKSALKKEGST